MKHMPNGIGVAQEKFISHTYFIDCLRLSSLVVLCWPLKTYRLVNERKSVLQVYCLLCVISQYQEYKAGRGYARSQNNMGTRVSWPTATALGWRRCHSSQTHLFHRNVIFFFLLFSFSWKQPGSIRYIAPRPTTHAHRDEKRARKNRPMNNSIFCSKCTATKNASE